jgi:peptidoglycan pentaglycine glycine transferase (the first glycine)
MRVEEIQKKEIWENFPNKIFLQNWEWGEFEKKGLGKKIWRLGFKKNEKLFAICLCIEEVGRFGKFIYCPRGPILNWENKEERVEILKCLTDFFREKGYVFLRIDPAVTEEFEVFKKLNFKDAASFIQVRRAWMLDIKGKTDEELMLGMRKNTRYSLKKAIRSGIQVKISEEEKDFEIFADLLQDLAKEKGFASVPSSYLKKQFEFMKRDFKFFCAKKNNEVIAGGWFSFFGDESSYLHGASSKEVGDSQAPYLIQWEAIKYAREKGFKRHNFWGVVEDKNYHPKYPGFGYSNFKKGFGGYLEEYIKTKDFVYNVVKYQPFRLNEWYRRVRYKGN